MGIETILAILGTAVALAALFGVFVAKYRTSKDDETLKIWREEAQAWKERAERLDTTLKAQQKSIELLTDRINKVERENELLRELVTGQKALEAIHSDLTTGLAELKVILVERGKRSMDAFHADLDRQFAEIRALIKERNESA